MICERCQGTGRTFKHGIQATCVDCGGCGRNHCCDGEQAQPEPAPRLWDDQPAPRAPRR